MNGIGTVMLTTVGERPNVPVRMEIYLTAFDVLARRYRFEGLTGDELDIAIREVLPHYLESLLSETALN